MLKRTQKKSFNNLLIKKNTILILFFLLFAFISFWSVSFHEMWRDEVQAWLLARDSNTIFDLFRNLKYEGHPGLWHLILFPLTRIFKYPISMQFLHVIIGLLNIYLLFRYSPFKFWQKVLIGFSYFLLYQYNVIARSYGLGVFFIFTACSLFPYRKKYPIQISLILVFLGHTSVLGLIYSICFLLTIILEELFFAKKSLVPTQLKISNKTLYFCLFLIISGYFTSIIQMLPASDIGVHNGWDFSFDKGKIFDTGYQISQAFLPFLISKMISIENYFLAHLISFFLCGFISLIVIKLAFRPSSLFLFLSTSFGLLLFFYVKFEGAVRHHGYIFIALISSLWIFKSCFEINGIKKIRFFNYLENIFESFLVLLLAFQSFLGLNSIYKDIKGTFSSAQKTAEFITEKGFSSATIIGHRSSFAMSVAGHLYPKKDFYYIDAQRFGTFLRWDDKRTIYKNFVRSNEEINLLNENALTFSNINKDVLLLLDYSFNKFFSRSKFYNNYTLIYKSQSSMSKENYLIYRLNTN